MNNFKHFVFNTLQEVASDYEALEDLMGDIESIFRLFMYHEADKVWEIHNQAIMEIYFQHKEEFGCENFLGEFITTAIEVLVYESIENNDLACRMFCMLS